MAAKREIERKYGVSDAFRVPDNHRPASEILEALHDLLDDEPLRPIARIRTRRSERSIHGADGEVLAVLADDRVSSQTLGERAVLQRWREIEVELVDGPRDVLDDIDEALRAAGAQPSAAGSKLAHALGDRQPTEARIDPDRADTLLGAYLRAQYAAIVNNEAGVRQGDPEAVHDMRVACRRLRSTLRSFAAVLDASQVANLGDELKWLAQVLGGVRDGDVLADRLAAPPPSRHRSSISGRWSPGSDTVWPRKPPWLGRTARVTGQRPVRRPEGVGGPRGRTRRGWRGAGRSSAPVGPKGGPAGQQAPRRGRGHLGAQSANRRPGAR